MHLSNNKRILGVESDGEKSTDAVTRSASLKSSMSGLRRRMACLTSGSTSIRRRLTSLAALSVAVVASTGAALSTSAAAGQVRARAASGQQCPDSQYSATRDPANPLVLSTTPGANPLNGAPFFVDGPRHGYAAGAIAQLMGLDPTNFADNLSWASFAQRLASAPMSQTLAHNPVLARKVRLLSKIAQQPEALRFSEYSGGGGPGAIYGQVQKIFCHNLTADPGTVPIIETLFIYPNGQYCPSLSVLRSNQGTFKRQINEMAAGTGRHPAVYLLELDSVGSSACLQGATRTLWEEDLRYEINAISPLPHTVVYTEGGYSDANSPEYTAKMLSQIGLSRIRGFFTNDTHLNWTTAEVKWANSVSQLLSSMTHHRYAAHFIVNTAQNGNGPLLNPHPVTQGNEDLCNPPGRGTGPVDTTKTSSPLADGFLWTHVPGRSSGSCNGGPPSGDFWAARAIQLSSRASERLGPS